MRVVLSGTSNAVIARGLNYPLGRDPRIDRFHNASYGASGSVAIGDHLQRIAFADFDFCVLDYCVNEEVFISTHESTTARAMNNLLAAVDAASRAGCQPLIVILPTATRATHPRPFEDAILAELATRGVPVFNFYAFARDIMAQTGLAFGDLFLDPMHIHREIGAAIGTALIDYMHARKDTAPVLTPTDLRHDPLHAVAPQDLAVIGDAAMESRESSLMERDCLTLRLGAAITVTGPGPAEVIGVTFDAARSVGTLTAPDGTTCLTLKPASAFFRKTRSLTLMTLPVPRPVPLDDAHRITLRHAFDGTLTDVHPPAAMTLAGVVLRLTGQDQPVHLLTRDSGPVDLQDWLTADQRIALAGTLAQTDAS